MAEVVSAAVGTTILLGSFVLFLFLLEREKTPCFRSDEENKKEIKTAWGSR